MALERVHETWAIDVHAALAPFRSVLLGQLIPGEKRYELVLTTRESPPGGDLVEALGEALGELIGRADSPVAARLDDAVRTATWRFYPPLDAGEREVLERLDWAHAVVLHEWVE